MMILVKIFREIATFEEGVQTKILIKLFQKRQRKFHCRKFLLQYIPLPGS